MRSRFHVEDGWGGRPQGGIAPSRKTSNIFVFQKATAAEEFGYFDGWHTDGCLHYTGEGKRGDQRMWGVNRALLRHREGRYRAIRVFEGSGGEVAYLGEFEIDPSQPYYVTDAPDVDRELRQVIVFRLRPVDIAPPHDLAADPLEGARIRVKAVEQQRTRGYLYAAEGGFRQGERREAGLVDQFTQFLRQQGDEVTSHLYKPRHEPRYLRNDLYNESRGQLIEAKGVVTREAIRSVIGQVVDYLRFEPPETRSAALLPYRPRADLEDLLDQAEMGAVWAEGDGFADNRGGLFTGRGSSSPS